MPSATAYTAGGAQVPGQDINFSGAIDVANNTLTVSGTGSMGYATAKGGDTATGGAVTQATNRTTSVTLNKICGTITTSSASLAAEAAAAFVVTNSKVAIGDVVLVSQQSGAVGAPGTLSAPSFPVPQEGFDVAQVGDSGGAAEEDLGGGGTPDGVGFGA